MSLSDKICPIGKYNTVECYLPEDIKAFIKELKKLIKENSLEGKITEKFCIDMINLKAGEKLIGGEGK